jgi:hypothetical protein
MTVGATPPPPAPPATTTYSTVPNDPSKTIKVPGDVKT